MRGLASLLQRALFCTGILLTCFTSLAKADTTTNFHPAYVGLFITEDVGSDFYSVMMDDKETPYLEIDDVLKKWLEMPVTETDSTIETRVPENQTAYIIDIKKQQFILANSMTLPIPAGALVRIKNHYYLRYDAWQSWLPVNSTWNLDNYELYLIPQFKLTSQMEGERQRLLKDEKRRAAEEKHLKKIPVLTPKNPLNAQLRYALNWTQPLKSGQGVGADYAGNVDVLKGTLQVTGNSQLVSGKNISSPMYWNYQFKNKKNFHLLEFGDFFNSQTLLMPAINLKNGIHFEKLEQKNTANGFSYHGQTQPGTEVDVWHNGVLLTILTADARGAFTFNDPNAKPGDQYLLRFYFKDGTEVNRAIQLSSSNQYLLEPPGAWNITFATGQLDNSTLGSGFNDTQLATGQFTHSGLFYGVTRNFTAGLEVYHFPTASNQNAGGVDLAWQTLPQWSNVLETTGYKQSVDEDWQSTYTGVDKHTFQFEQQRLGENSPIKALALPLPYTLDLAMPVVLPSADRFWSIKDIYNPNQFQFTSQYKRADVGDALTETVLSSLTQSISASLTTGLVRPYFGAATPFTQVTGFYYLNSSNLLQAQRTIAQQSSNSTLAYRYQGLADSNWDATISVQKPDHSTIWNWQSGIEYRFLKNFSATVSAGQHEIDLTFSYLGLIAEQPGPIDYDNFATGTVSGTVTVASETPGGAPTPVANAEVIAAGLTTYTDKNGEFLLSGLPTNQRLYFSVNPGSLDASLIPDQSKQAIWLRPGTYIEINPKIDWSSGIDGNIVTNSKIPRGMRIVAVRKLGGKVIRSAHVESNGFFILDKLRPGVYYLELQGENIATPPAPFKLTITNNEHWQSNINIPWNAPVVARNEKNAPQAKTVKAG